MTPSQIIHRLSGSPVFAGAADGEGRCWLCGGEAVRGLPTAEWQGAQFTDQNKARAQGATHVCEACAWSCSWVQPPGFPPPAPGKRGVHLRLFSHLWAHGEEPEYLALNKASKPAIREWLRREHPDRWFAAIADSGQKHTLPWTPVNDRSAAGVGLVYFEERAVRLPGADGWHMVDDIGDLLTCGVTKDEVALKHYSARSIMTERTAVAAFEAEWSELRGGAWFELAVWLAQRDEEGELHGRLYERGTAGADGGGRDGAPPRLPRRGREPAQALGPDHVEAPKRRSQDVDGERVGDGGAQGPGTQRPGQLTLF